MNNLKCFSGQKKIHCSHLKIYWSVWRWWTLGLPLPAFTLHLMQTRIASSEIYKTAIVVIEIIADSALIIKPDKVNDWKKELWMRHPATTNASLESLGELKASLLGGSNKTSNGIKNSILKKTWNNWGIYTEKQYQKPIFNRGYRRISCKFFRQIQFLNDKIK